MTIHLSQAPITSIMSLNPACADEKLAERPATVHAAGHANEGDQALDVWLG